MTTKGTDPLTEEQWLKYIQQKTLKFIECEKCHKKSVIPTEVCSKCGSHNIIWKQCSGRGIIYTYTITTVAPPELQSIVPYIAAVVELDEGLRINGIITRVPNVGAFPVNLIGKSVQLEFIEIEKKVTLAFRIAS